MAEIVKDIAQGTPWYMYIMIIFSIGLLVGAFICPPIGVIDESVYRSVAILFAGVTALRLVDQLPTFIARGAKIRATAKPDNGISVEISKDKEEK